MRSKDQALSAAECKRKASGEEDAAMGEKTMLSSAIIICTISAISQSAKKAQRPRVRQT